jgi:hypothetical protein
MAKTTDPTKNFGSFTNAAGEVYTIHGLSPLLPAQLMGAAKAEFEKSGEILPEIPTYEVTTIGGEKEIHQHDSTTLVVEGDEAQTKANQKAWLDYTKAYVKLNNAYNLRVMHAAFLAVEVEPTQAWRDEMKFIGAEIHAEGSVEERYAFVETHVIQCPADLSKLTLMVFRMSGIIPEEATAEVDATFQRAVERAFVEAGKSGNQKK